MFHLNQIVTNLKGQIFMRLLFLCCLLFVLICGQTGLKLGYKEIESGLYGEEKGVDTLRYTGLFGGVMSVLCRVDGGEINLYKDGEVDVLSGFRVGYNMLSFELEGEGYVYLGGVDGIKGLWYGDGVELGDKYEERRLSLGIGFSMGLGYEYSFCWGDYGGDYERVLGVYRDCGDELREVEDIEGEIGLKVKEFSGDGDGGLILGEVLDSVDLWRSHLWGFEGLRLNVFQNSKEGGILEVRRGLERVLYEGKRRGDKLVYDGVLLGDGDEVRLLKHRINGDYGCVLRGNVFGDYYELDIRGRGVYRIELYDVMGRILGSDKMELEGFGVYRGNLNERGIFFVKVKGNGVDELFKLIR